MDQIQRVPQSSDLRELTTCRPTFPDLSRQADGHAMALIVLALKGATGYLLQLARAPVRTGAPARNGPRGRARDVQTDATRRSCTLVPATGAPSRAAPGTLTRRSAPGRRRTRWP